MKFLAFAVLGFAVLAGVAGAFGRDPFLYLVAGAAAVCAWTTWRSGAISPFLRIFAAIFATETVVFGLATVALRMGLWPDRLKALETAVLTPHMAAIAEAAQVAQREMLASNLAAFFAGVFVEAPAAR